MLIISFESNYGFEYFELDGLISSIIRLTSGCFVGLIDALLSSFLVGELWLYL